MNLIGRFNVWFDHLKEPRRFLIFMGIMCFAIFPLQLGLEFHNKPATFIGLTVLCIMSAIGCVRALGRGGKHKYVGLGMMAAAVLVALMTTIIVFA